MIRIKPSSEEHEDSGTSYIFIVRLSFLRASSHFESSHLCEEILQTMDAESGLSSCLKLYGSALKVFEPPLMTISYLYFSPASIPGINNSKMPLLSSLFIGMPRPFQELKSPHTLTRTASGAHTLNTVPRTPLTVFLCAPIYS